jgi:hypothetical protein
MHVCLEINGRFSTDSAPFLAQRANVGCVEDVKHFLLEGLAYQHLHANYPCVFGDAMPDSSTRSEQMQSELN